MATKSHVVRDQTRNGQFLRHLKFQTTQSDTPGCMMPNKHQVRYLSNLAAAVDALANLAHIQGIVVTLGVGAGVDVGRVLPGLERGGCTRDSVLSERKSTQVAMRKSRVRWVYGGKRLARADIYRQSCACLERGGVYTK